MTYAHLSPHTCRGVKCETLPQLAEGDEEPETKAGLGEEWKGLMGGVGTRGEARRSVEGGASGFRTRRGPSRSKTTSNFLRPSTTQLEGQDLDAFDKGVEETRASILFSQVKSQEFWKVQKGG